jgi:outer membrane protein
MDERVVALAELPARRTSSEFSVCREQSYSMFPTQTALASIRPVTFVLLWTCLLSGCSHSLASPSIEPRPPLPQNQAASDPDRPVPSNDQRLGTACPDCNHADALDQPSAIPAGEATIVPASGDAGSIGASDSDFAALPLTLPEAVAFALENNPRLRSALAATERAGGLETVAFAPFLPQVDLLNRFVATNKAILPGAPGPTGAVNPLTIGNYEIYQGELQLLWTLYDFGRTAGRYGQASMREKIARLQALRAKQTVAYDVATAYFQALEALALRRIAVETVRRAQAVLEDVRARKEGGVALRDDVLRDDVQLADSRDALVRSEDAEITALAQLNNAMGRDASLPLRPVEGANPPDFTASLAECLQRAAVQRPEVGVARDRVAAARFGREAARGEFLPELSLKGSLGRIDGENVVGGFSEGAGIQLSVPLYHRGESRGNLRVAEADIRQAAADAQGVLNDISLEVTVAHRGVRSAQVRVDLARPAVEQSTEALRIVRERYRDGTATPTDVIAAETAATRAEQRYISARLDYLSALARLAYVLGDDPEGLCSPLSGPQRKDKAAARPLETLPMPRREPEVPGAD